jgi:energy-coupling factor transporter transmembrane protein EcfT
MRWARGHIPILVVSLAVGFLVSWSLDVLLVAGQYGGEYKVPPGSSVTVPGNEIPGFIFWFGFNFVICAVVTKAIILGPSRFTRGLRNLPASVVNLFRGDPHWLAHFLWGLAISLVIGIVVSAALGIVFAAGLLLVTTGAVRWIISGLLASIVSAITGRIRPGQPAITR